MVSELALLSAAVYSREAWEAVQDHVQQDDLTAHGFVLWQAIGTYYKRDLEADAVDLAVLSSTVQRENPDRADSFAQAISELTPDFGGANVARELLALKRDAVGDELMEALAAKRKPEDMAPLLAKYQGLNEATGLHDMDSVEVFDTPIEEVIRQREKPGVRMKVYPPVINQYLRGGVLPGHCIVIFGRVNVGKSVFAINMVAGFLKQGKTVLYIENEDNLDDTATRMACRLTGWDQDRAAKDPDRFGKGARRRGLDRFILVNPPATIQAVEQLIQRHDPDVVVVNQARNLTQGSKDSVQQMDAIAKGLRGIAKRHRKVAVLVTAAKEGEPGRDGKVREKWRLEMADCYSSRTGFPAAADVMIGVGNSKSLVEREMLCLSLCKNKLSRHSDETLYVNVDFGTCKVTGDEKHEEPDTWKKL